jgi:hypothetical protein
MAPPQQPPPIAQPVLPIETHVWQQADPLSQPLLSISPSGPVVRQKIAPLVLAPLRLAPVRFASTKQLPLNWLFLKLAPEALAPVKLAWLMLLPETFLPWKIEEPAKSHRTLFFPLPGIHGEPS